MPTNNVDLSAVLPVLDAAVKPFADAMAELDSIPLSSRPNDMTVLRNYIGLNRLQVNDIRKLVQAVEAVQRMAGERV